MNQEKIKESQQYEISITELAAVIYLFFMRKWLFIIILTIAGLLIGFLSGHKEPSALYMVDVKISSGIVKTILMNNALSYIWCEPCDEAGIEKSSALSKKISAGIYYVKKMENSSTAIKKDLMEISTTAINKDMNVLGLVLFVQDSAKTQNGVNDIINFVLDNDTIKSIVRDYRNYYKNYMTKLDKKIANIESLEKNFQSTTGDEKLESTIIKGWLTTSNRDYLDLLDKRFYMQIWDDSENPITAEIISVNKTVVNSLARRLVLWGFSSFLIAVFLGFAYDFHIKVLSHIRENAIQK